MNKNFLNIYNNLIKLTRNKNLYKINEKNDLFSDRLLIFFLHFAFFIQKYKKDISKDEMQKIYDLVFKEIETSIREIGYGDATINKKMKEYVNLLFSIIDKINEWENIDKDKKKEILTIYIEDMSNFEIYLEYFEKYRIFLSKNSFNNLTKDIISL